MGVHSFWDIVGPTAKPVRLESLQDRRMAVDASIWIYQFLKAVRDQEGNALKHSHIVGFFRRICKLLYFGIKPIFVFDGGVPALKRSTIQQRKERRQGKRDNAAITARKLLAIQLQKKESSGAAKSTTVEADKETTSQELFRPQDEWHLPVIPGFQYDKDDQRVVSAETFEKMVNSVDEELDNIDLDSINPASEEFEELPKSTQYLILSTLRLKSRLRMGYTKEQLEHLFPNSMDFSKFQIDMVKRRNFFTQKLMGVTGMNDGGSSKLNDEVARRVSGQLNKEYKLTKSDSGWTLGLGEFDGSETQKAIVLEGEDIEAFNYIKSHGEINNVAPSTKTAEDQITGEIDEIVDNDDNDDNDDCEWEDVDVKPQKAQLREDYSIKAARLPQLERQASSAGSQSFLDKRHDHFSPVKRPYSKIIQRIEDKIEDSEEENEEEDDYKRQLEEIELIEEAQRSKNAMKQLREQQENFKRPRLERNSTLETVEPGVIPDKTGDESSFVHDHPPPSASKSEKLPLYQDGPADVGKATGKSSHSRDEVTLSENQQNLNHIISKIPDFNFGPGDSFLFSDSSNSHGKMDTQKPKLNVEAKEGRPVQKPPAWFASSEAPVNPFAASNFVQDKEISKANDRDSSDKFKLVSGLDAQNLLLGENNDENAVEEVIDVTSKVDSEEDIDQAPPQTREAGENNRKERQALAFDYDFSEEEEDNLTESMRKEAEEFATFKSTLSNKVVDNAFMEDELFEQQMKDKRDSDEVTPDMIIEVQDLLSRFGIPFLTAPMEAEAQCAELLHLKLVDGIITDDSDVFLFGGTKVYKNMFQEKNYVEFYDEISINQNLGLNRDRMIELAQLLGSDYTNGIKGMGPVSSMEVLAEFGCLTKFREWYNQGQFDKKKQQAENSFEKNLRKKLVKNEVVLTTEFPSDLVREAYIRPEVDHDTTAFSWGTPDLDMLRQFMKTRVGWPQEKSDEVLVPLIRDINGREKQARQMKLNEFFPSSYMEGKKLNLGRRIATATAKLKQR